MTPTQKTDAVVLDDPDIECPLCKDGISAPVQDHLLADHTHMELARLVARYTYEREEKGTIL